MATRAQKIVDRLKPLIRVQKVDLDDRYYHVGELPGEYTRPRPMPCPECRRVRLDTMGQAVILKATSYDGTVAYLHCKSCKHDWKLPVTHA